MSKYNSENNPTYGSKHSSKYNTEPNAVNKTRRNFLKGAAYTSALSIAGVSSLAYALNENISTSYIHKFHMPYVKQERVSLINDSDKAITLDASSPVIIKRVNGSLVAKPNLISSNATDGMIMMEPHQRISFEVQTKNGLTSHIEIADISNLYEQPVHMSSVYPAFNNLVPVIDLNVVIT